MTKRLTGFLAAVALVFACLAVGLNVGCNSDVDNTVTTPEGATVDPAEVPKQDEGATAPAMSADPPPKN